MGRLVVAVVVLPLLAGCAGPYAAALSQPPPTPRPAPYPTAADQRAMAPYTEAGFRATPQVSGIPEGWGK